MNASEAELEAELRRVLLPFKDTTDNNAKKATQEAQQKNASAMGAMERLMLSPWEKWTKHGRFPYKLLLHVALILLTFAQMQLFDAQNAAYMRASYRNWCVQLLGRTVLDALD